MLSNRFITRIEGVGDIIRSIFADGTDGFYFDFSKTDQTFQTTSLVPADDATESIGLGLEAHAWNGLSYAALVASRPELLANTEFDTATGWTAFGTGASIAGGKLTVATSVSGGVTGTNILTSGRFYLVNIDVVVRAGVGRVVLGSFSLDVTTKTFNATGSYQYILQANNTAPIIERNGGTVDFDVERISIKEIPGNHGLQSTAAARPSRQTGGIARFDGSDDNLLTTLVPSGTSFSLMAKSKITSSLTTKIALGASDGTNRCWLGLDNTDVAAVRFGSGAQVSGAVSLAGAFAVLGATCDGTTIRLYVNGSEVATGAFAGALPSLALMLGAANTSGAASAFCPEDADYKLAIKKALTAAEIAAITNLWGTS